MPAMTRRGLGALWMPAITRRGVAVLCVAVGVGAAVAPSARAALAAAPGTGGAALVPATASPPTATGGAALGGLAPVRGKRLPAPSPPSRRAPGRWLAHTVVTEYWPAPEAWFSGALVRAPGLSGEHRVDWLYSATGVAMEGEGVGLDGRTYHIDALGSGGWVTLDGRATSPLDGWAAGTPFWRAGAFWRNRQGAVTFPLAGGGWSAGAGRRFVPLPGVTFAVGASLPLRYLHSVAVDPSVIPLGSRVYIPAYRTDGFGGWFVAQDTGGAIRGRHVDVFRAPPPSPSDGGQFLRDQRIYVIRPK